MALALEGAVDWVVAVDWVAAADCSSCIDLPPQRKCS